MTRLSDIRKQIQKQRGVEFKKLSRKVVLLPDRPSAYKKSNLMKLIELKYNDRLENLIFNGTIYEVAKKLNIDPTTVSKWRKLIDRTFFAQFGGE